MLNRIIIFIICTFFAFSACKMQEEQSVKKAKTKELCNDFDTIRIDGTYLGANLYFINPLVDCIDTTICYTTQKVIVNDTIIFKEEQLNGSTFEVPLKNIGYKMNTKIKMELIHINGYLPRVLHKEIHR